MVHPDIHPNRFYLIAKTDAIYQQTRIRHVTFAKGRETSFMGNCTMTKEQLDYMILCAKETRARKTW